MLTITLIQISIFFVYTLFLLFVFKKPLPSYSDSWYQLKNPIKNLFTLFCWSIGFLMPFQSDGTTPFFFLSGAGICFVGAARMFKTSMTGKVHFIGAFILIVSAFAGLYFERGEWLPFIVFLFASILILYNASNRIWWIEVCAFISICYGLLISA